METSVERLESTSVRVVLTFDEAEVKKAFGKAYGDLSSQVTIPGFRPGRAPRMILDQVLGREAVRSQVMGDLVPEAITEAVDAEGLLVVGEPELTYDPPEPDRPFVVTATLSVMPEVEIGDLGDIELVKPVLRPRPEQIDAMVERLREQAAVSADVEDRGVQQGDFVYVSYQVTADGTPLYDSDPLPNLFLEVGAEYYTPVIDYGIIGMVSGESRDIPVEYPEDFRDERLSGKSATFTATVDRITVRQAPDLDEGFLERHGASDLQSLRERLQREWEQEANSHVDDLLESQAMGVLVQRCAVEVPDGFVQSRFEELDAQYRERVGQEGQDFEHHLQELSQTLEAYEAGLRDSARREICQYLVIRAAAKRLSLEATDEDLEEAVWTLARSTNRTFSEMWDILEQTETLDDMRTRRTTEKVLKHVVEQASKREVELTDDEFNEGEWARGIPGLGSIAEDADEDAEPGADTGGDEAPDAEPSADEEPGLSPEPEASADPVDEPREEAP